MLGYRHLDVDFSYHDLGTCKTRHFEVKGKNMKRHGIASFVFALLLALCLSFSGHLHAQTVPFGPYGNIPMLGTNSFTGATGTIAATQLNGIVAASGQTTATLTTDTAANICAAFPFVGNSNAQGWNYVFWLKNVNSGNTTLAGGTGVTLVGTATTTTVNIRLELVVLTSCVPGSQAVTIYSGPQGTY